MKRNRTNEDFNNTRGKDFHPAEKEQINITKKISAKIIE